ncbi:hypothetical protein F5876DRAFT_71352 [Lentinula aff. lateritia]|uniref:Uncharacterized protein n=1 Tax=Lentinula aff. lateritia TaxID=2804960 RepID=A0ACC1TFM9_9AGAR|nr:hypothetical protein F5876DRAFT_71352 [Lentinula aff. lateritia]
MYKLPMECKPGREVPRSGGSGGRPQALEVVTEKRHVSELVEHLGSLRRFGGDDRRDKDKSRQTEIEKQRVKRNPYGMGSEEGDIGGSGEHEAGGFHACVGGATRVGESSGFWKWEGYPGRGGWTVLERYRDREIREIGGVGACGCYWDWPGCSQGMTMSLGQILNDSPGKPVDFLLGQYRDGQITSSELDNTNHHPHAILRWLQIQRQ